MPNETTVQAFLDPKNTFAVVGVSADPAKYGHRVFLDLLEAGYTVYAVHPDGGTVAGRPWYRDLAALPRKPDVVNVVVSPEVTERIVAQCVALGIAKVWMQPGAESPDAVAACERNGIQVLHDVCVMVERRRA